MTNLQKRILTSSVILPLSVFLISEGEHYLSLFLIFILFVGFHELFTTFKKIKSILFLSSILILSLLSIYYLRNYSDTGKFFLLFIIGVSVCSDIGGYIFGKIFKWKKFTKISPKKTISGIFGSYFFSIVFLVVLMNDYFSLNITIFPMIYLHTILLSTMVQIGDLIVSYFKRLEKIKDTGKILPGHGGIFDRIDGLMFALIFGAINFHYFLS